MRVDRLTKVPNKSQKSGVPMVWRKIKTGESDHVKKVRILPLYSYNIFVNKKYCEDDPRPYTKQGWGTMGPKGILEYGV